MDPAVVAESVDQRVTLHGVSWSEFEHFLEVRGDQAGIRVAYLDGALELMTPSRDHEILRTTIARLLETYAEELGIELEGYGSWTLTRQDVERGLEPDECYSIGRTESVPDVAIAVVWTSGGLNKLEIHRLLGVREVWQWKDDAMSIFALRGNQYVSIGRSEVLPAIDVSLICSLLDAPTQTAAIRALRAHLRAQPPSRWHPRDATTISV